MKLDSQRKLNLIYGDAAALDRNFGQRGDIYYDHEAGSLRVYNGLIQGGRQLVKDDLTNVSSTATLSVATVSASAGFIGNLSGNVTGTHNGAVIGNVTGNLTGNVTGNLTGNVTGNVTGDVKSQNGTTVLDSGTNGTNATFVGNITGNVNGNVTGNLTGDVTGTVSSIANHTTTSLAEGTNQYFTQARARQSLSQGTGVTYNSTSGEISIGQAVATTSNVTFNDIIVSGNLTVQGNTTTLNTSTLDVEDLNITVAKGAANATAANGAGLTVDGANATITYISASDSWAANKLLSAVGLTSTGTTNVQQITEVVNTKTGATGVVTHDYSTGAIFYHTSIAANFTANLTNVPTTNNRSITIAIGLVQGATAYIPSALQVDGNAVSINWSGGSAPTGSANKLDFVTFTLLRVSSTWTAIGQLSSFG